MRRCALLVVVLALAGCGSGGARIAKDDLPSLVLRAGDLGPDFSEFARGAQARADLHPGPRQDPLRHGRLGGWISRYRHVTTPSGQTVGPLVVESRADLYKSSGGAKKDLGDYKDEYEGYPASVGVEKLDAPKLGDDAVAFRFGSALDRFVVVAWRESNATASVLVEGPAVGLEDASRLARKQQARLAAAAA
jgi:hypothetical protein